VVRSLSLCFGALALLWPTAAASTETCAIGATCEAESAVLGGGVVARASYAGYTGTGFAHYAGTGSGYVEWTVRVPTAGPYWLGFRYAHGGTADRPLSIGVNGTIVNRALSFPVTSWTRWRLSTQNVELPAGAVTIRATETSNGPNMDNLTVTSGTAPLPTNTPGATPTSTSPPAGCAIGTICEAETARLGPEVVTSSLHGGYTGSGFADYTGNGNGFIEWTVSVPTAGTYSLSFRYANGGTADRPMVIQVNGTVVNSGMPFPVTGSWTSWMVRTARARLPAGSVRIRAAETRNGPNVDNLIVTAGAPQTPSAGGPPVWGPNFAYAVDTVVTYGGAAYRCIKAHTSQVGWEPPNVASLWTPQ
jgi:Carbohydrate binding module (family 6)